MTSGFAFDRPDITLPAPAASSAPTRRLHVITWGCQMNVYDSGRMEDVLAPLGYAATATAADADMVILNTCHIRDRAAEKVFSELGRLRLVKEERRRAGRDTTIAVAGCVAQAEGEAILSRAPFVDLVVGPQSYHKLPELVARLSRRTGAVIETDFPVEQKFDFLPETSARPVGPTAFLTVQEGCDKFCSFCVVPYVRGAEASRPVASVLAEARRLVSRGAREITLLGQNVNAYHGEDGTPRPATLALLVERLAAIPGLARIRYTTSHPRDMDDALIRAHRDIPALMPFLHLPVQSGSDRVLRLMNRGHDGDLFRRLVDRIRDARPDMALSSDFIVGHPGETDADHAATMSLVREIGFASAFSFKYSPRPGTPSATFADAIPEHVKDERLQELQGTLRAQQASFNADLVGRTVPVLFTGPGRHPGQVSGRSPYLQSVHGTGDSDALTGRIVAVPIVSASVNSISFRFSAEMESA